MCCPPHGHHLPVWTLLLVGGPRSACPGFTVTVAEGRLWPGVRPPSLSPTHSCRLLLHLCVCFTPTRVHGTGLGAPAPQQCVLVLFLLTLLLARPRFGRGNPSGRSSCLFYRTLSLTGHFSYLDSNGHLQCHLSPRAPPRFSRPLLFRVPAVACEALGS